MTKTLIKSASKAPTMIRFFGSFRTAAAAPYGRAALVFPALLALCLSGRAQQPQPDTTQQQPATATPAAAPDATQAATPASESSAPASAQDGAQAAAAASATQQATAAIPVSAPAGQAGAITEDQLKQMLVGKQFYLRGGYLGDSLNFDEHGHIVSHSPQGSYTLGIVQIDHVRLTKHKVELEGVRYGLHFNEQLAYEDSSTAFDKVRITPKKKVVRITIDREMVVNPKKKKESGREKAGAAKAAKLTHPTMAAAPVPGPSASAAPVAETPVAAQAPVTDTTATTQATGEAPAAVAPATTTAVAATPSSPAGAAAPSAEAPEMSEADQLKASIAATPEAERPADPSSVTTTTSQGHANKLLHDAIDAAFAPGLDERMMAAMPAFWKLYYQAVANKADYRPTDPGILRQNTVDQKAHLLTSFEPDSNDFAQAAGVAGMALYHTIIGSDGQPGEIAVARPIGFGLDESAVASIRKAKFAPAMKDGKPVPVMLDLVVQFRIFSKRTAVQNAPETASDKDRPPVPMLPGPYSVLHPN